MSMNFPDSKGDANVVLSSSIIFYNNAFFPPFLKNDPNLAGDRSVALRLSLSSLSGSSVGYSNGFLTISSSSSSNSPRKFRILL